MTIDPAFLFPLNTSPISSREPDSSFSSQLSSPIFLINSRGEMSTSEAALNQALVSSSLINSSSWASINTSSTSEGTSSIISWGRSETNSGDTADRVSPTAHMTAKSMGSPINKTIKSPKIFLNAFILNPLFSSYLLTHHNLIRWVYLNKLIS